MLFPLAVAAVMLVAALPDAWLGPLADEDRCRVSVATDADPERQVSCREWMVEKLRLVSVSQSWGMYAPAPQRTQAYMLLTAVELDGSERALAENEIARDGWGTGWAWNKSRMDILRHAVGYFRSSKPNRNRVWFLRGICVREAREGAAPARIRMDQVKRRFTAPDRVRAGSPVLGAEEIKEVQVVGCEARIVQDMIAEDRERRGG